MWKKNLRRFIGKLLISLLTIFLVATFNFFLIRFMPGDPLEHLVGEEDYLYLTSAHPEVLEELEVEYGLDGTLWETLYSKPFGPWSPASVLRARTQNSSSPAPLCLPFFSWQASKSVRSG